MTVGVADAAGETRGELRVRRLLRLQPERPRFGALVVLVLSFAAYVLASGQLNDPRSLGILVGVILFHEAGHWAGMRAFGYRDVRMFFIPFFGAAVSGKPRGVSPAKRAVVLLLGPGPGLFVAAVLALLFHPSTRETLGTIVVTLAIINGLNLLPFEPFDGGKLAHLLVASRSRWLEALSLAASAAGLAWLASRLGSTSLGVLAFFTAMTVRRRWGSAEVAADVRRECGPLPDAIEDAPDAALERLDREARQRLRQGMLSNDAWERAVIAWCRETYDRALSSSPPAATSVGLGAAALAAFALGFFALVLVVRPRRTVVGAPRQAATSVDGGGTTGR